MCMPEKQAGIVQIPFPNELHVVGMEILTALNFPQNDSVLNK